MADQTTGVGELSVSIQKIAEDHGFSDPAALERELELWVQTEQRRKSLSSEETKLLKETQATAKKLLKQVAQFPRDIIGVTNEFRWYCMMLISTSKSLTSNENQDARLILMISRLFQQETGKRAAVTYSYTNGSLSGDFVEFLSDLESFLPMPNGTSLSLKRRNLSKNQRAELVEHFEMVSELGPNPGLGDLVAYHATKDSSA